MSRLRLSMMMLALVLVVAACGDSGDDGGTEGAPDATAIELSVVAVDFEFTPDAYLADAGDEVTVTLVNEGSLEHNWVLLESAVTSEAELDGVTVLAEALSQAGESATVTFSAPAAGTYQVICDIPGHLAAGMEGELVVSG